MSAPRRSYAAYLKPTAFKPYTPQEIKGSPFSKQQKPPKWHFDKLFKEYKKWGQENECLSDATETWISYDKLDQYSRETNQSHVPLFTKVEFEIIIENLAYILSALKDDKIPLEKRKKAFLSIYPDKSDDRHYSHFRYYILSNIETTRNQLSSNDSPEYWLAELRTSIISQYASEYSAKHNLRAHQEIHAFNNFAKYASDHKLNPLPTQFHDEDQAKEEGIKVKPRDFIDFQEYFDNAYNPTDIRECIRHNIEMVLTQCFKEFGFKYNGWNTMEAKNYQALVNKVRTEITKIGMTFSEEELFEYDIGNERFRARNTDFIVNRLCNSLLNIGPELYFDTAHKKYLDLLPAHWLNDKLKPAKFDFGVWNKIPDEKFAQVLFNLLDALPIEQIKPLLENLPLKKLKNLVKYEKDSNNVDIYKMRNSVKRELIIKTFDTLVPPMKTEPKKKKEASINTQSETTAAMQAAYLDSKSLASLSVASRGTYALFKKPLSQRLLLHVVCGKQDEAEEIIKNNPDLLFQSITLKDYSGRTLRDVTPITAAYGADDVEMLTMMFKYLDKSEKYKAINQIQEKFPLDIESKPYDFTALVIAITTETNVEEALEEFRNDFTPGVIDKGKHFNLQYIIDAYEIYQDNYQDWSDRQRSIFFVQVIGYLQRLLPACYAQAICQGIMNHISVSYYKNQLERELQLENGTFFYPPDNSRSGLGFDFAAAISDARDRHRRGYVRGYEERGYQLCYEQDRTLVSISILHKRKTSELYEIIMLRPDKEEKPGCTIS